MINISDSSVQN